ncbi:hypothetical protein PTKIN_Ptkin13bG0210500 [Pterospermum kingtungense]
MDSGQKRISVVMFPWLAHGHISPFLELSKQLTKRNFYIYFCSTPVNLHSIQPKISPQYSNSIQFVELHLPSLPELPPHYHTTNGLPPHLMETLKKAFDMSSHDFAKILKTLNPDLLIYDFIQPWAPKLALSLDIPAIHFLCSSAIMASLVYYAVKKPCQEFPCPEFSHAGDFMKPKASKNLLQGPSVSDIQRIFQCFELSSDIILMKTFREIEGKYLDYIEVAVNKKTVPVGPLVQDYPNIEDDHEGKEIMEWLSKKSKYSTVFASFGSEYFLSKDEMEEIAYGLELSQVNFIWVIRFPVGEKIKLEDALPQGFLERIGERGLVVETWAPQAKILQHTSIGGFVSHCGWSSVMESLKFGVPIIAMPMHLDQPVNARIVVDVGAALEVRTNKDGKLEKEEIAKVIKVVVAEKDGENVRRKAREMSNHILRKGDKEIDEAVGELIQLCK